MEYALGTLHWTPDVFWRSTMHELMAANRGYIKANTPPDDTKPATREDFEMLKKKFGEKRGGETSCSEPRLFFMGSYPDCNGKIDVEVNLMSGKD